jgi:magnesium transporter
MLEYNDALQAEQVSLFLGRNFVLTFQEDATDNFEPIRDRIRKGSGQFRKLGADYLMYAILDATVDHYFPFLESFGETVEELEDLVVEQPTRQTLGEVHDVRRDLLNVRRCVWPLRDVVGDLLRDETPLVTKGTRVYLRDVHQHLVYLLDLVETYRELATSLMDVYISSVSNKLNEVMKVLTIIATIFMPLTFLAGVYGMNFQTDKSPFNMPELTWRWGYVAFWAVILLTAVFMLILFRRRGWLGGKASVGSEPARGQR